MNKGLLLSLALALPLAGQQAHFEGFKLYPVDGSIAPDPAVEKVLAPYRAQLEAKFGRVLCQAPEGLFRGRKGEPNALGAWMADLMREAAAKATGLKVDAALTNSGGLRANIRRGPVTVASIYEVMPFDNELVVIELKGEDLIHAIKQGIERRAGEPVSNLHATLSGTPDQPVCTVTFADGTPVDPSAIYRVATSDYLAKSGDTMRALAGRAPLDTGLKLRDVALQACESLGKESKPLLPPQGNRYTIPDAFLDPLDQQKVKLP
ncbi:MAG: 5'-nucleotidase C-terminal domain-containing protein [Acidobacteria bacterium]|nr:5'-nucleotidase C-terminal domain-containing protein [Acidobacteriota bacterium]